MAHLKPQAKILLVVVAAFALIFGLRTLASYGIIPTPGIMKAIIPQKAVLPDVKDAQVANVTPVAMPVDASASVQATQIAALSGNGTLRWDFCSPMVAQARPRAA